MIKAVIFDMFETLMTLFEGRTCFGEDLAACTGAELTPFRKEWHATEKDRSTGRYTVEEALELVLKRLGMYTEEKVKTAAQKRREALEDSFSAVPEDSVRLLRELRGKGIRTGLITNAFSDERDMIRGSILFPFFDAALISFDQGICKPDAELFRRITAMLHTEPQECLYAGDGGSGELFAAREAGMRPVQCTWFHERAYEPHIPCPILEEFEHAAHPLDILQML